MLFLERAHAAAGMGHFVIDPVSHTIEFSSWVRKNLGLYDQPIPIERLPEIVVPEERERVASAVARAMASQIEFEFEATVVTRDGSHQIQKVSGITAFEDPENRDGLIGYFGIIRDVTEEKSSEDRLRQARDEAKAQLAAKTNILAVVSHEIRTPLGGILGIIDHLRNEQSTFERNRALRLVEDSCDALLDTLDGLLQQARIGHDHDNLESKPFRPKAVAQRVAELFRPLARRKGIRIKVDCKSERQAIGDQARLQQVIANLVSNAVKFTHSGHVCISIEQLSDSPSDWLFEVSDTGSGMDEKRARSVFDAFSPSEKDSLGKSTGAGLGLSITKELVDLMQGQISVESAPGKGSTFTFQLPLGLVETANEPATRTRPQGIALVHVERASTQIQIEAIVSQFGLTASALAEFETDNATGRQPAVLIANTHMIGDVPELLTRSFKSSLILIDGPERGEIDHAIAEKALRIPSENLTHELTNLLEGKNIAVA